MERCIPDTNVNVGVKCCSTIARYHKEEEELVYDDAGLVILQRATKCATG